MALDISFNFLLQNSLFRECLSFVRSIVHVNPTQKCEFTALSIFLIHLTCFTLTCNLDNLLVLVDGRGRGGLVEAVIVILDLHFIGNKMDWTPS